MNLETFNAATGFILIILLLINIILDGLALRLCVKVIESERETRKEVDAAIVRYVIDRTGGPNK